MSFPLKPCQYTIVADVVFPLSARLARSEQALQFRQQIIVFRLNEVEKRGESGERESTVMMESHARAANASSDTLLVSDDTTDETSLTEVKVAQHQLPPTLETLHDNMNFLVGAPAGIGRSVCQRAATHDQGAPISKPRWGGASAADPQQKYGTCFFRDATFQKINCDGKIDMTN